MKRGTLRHRKLQRLATDLDIQPLYAAGILEGLWHWTAETAPNGDLGDVTGSELAAGIGYQGSGKALIGALLRRGWLEKAGTCLWVHDWYDHADYDVHASVARRRQWFQNAQVPKFSKLKPGEKEAAEEFYANSQGIPNEGLTNRALPSHSQAIAKPITEAAAPPPEKPLKPEAVVPPELNTPEFLDAWKRWKAYRREIRKPLTESTIEGQLKKLAKVGPKQAIDLIENSIANSWRGLFFPNHTGSQNDPHRKNTPGSIAPAATGGFKASTPVTAF